MLSVKESFIKSKFSSPNVEVELSKKMIDIFLYRMVLKELKMFSHQKTTNLVLYPVFIFDTRL